MSTYEYMEPADYVNLYHNLNFQDPISGFIVTAEVTGYGSGWGPEPGYNRKATGPTGPACSSEFNQRYLQALRMLHHGNANTVCGSPFYLSQDPVPFISPGEDFYGNTLIRAFVGKGSPDEITDTLRLALAVGRIGIGSDDNGLPPSTATAPVYCRSFMTLDCNGLSGNYYGIDPNTPVQSYANSSRRRTDVGSITQADALVTVTPGGGYKHIALVQRCTVKSANQDGSGTVDLEIVEWGDEGSIAVHRPVPNINQAVRRGARSDLGLGYASEGNFRYFFAPPQPPTPRRWGLRGNPSL